jgi:hypothetical protein
MTFVAAVHAEVDVEVGHRHAFGIEEALEQQVVRQRVEVGDAQCPRHQRAGAGAAAGTDRDALRLAPVDEVRNDQEVTGEPHLDDDVQLGFQARVVLLAGLAGRERIFLQARGQAFARGAAQPRLDRVVARHRECRQCVLAQLHRDVAARGERDRIVDRIGDVGEQRRHFLGRFQVLLGAVFLGSLGIVEHPARSDAHARLVRLEALGVEEAHVVACDQRDAAARRGMQGEGVERVLAFAAATGQLQVQALAEHLAPVRQRGLGELVAVRADQLSRQALAADQRKQAAVVFAQPLRAQRHAVDAVAFHPCAGKQARQGQVAAAVAAQQGHPRRGLVAVGEADVGADDRLEARTLGRLVELHRREQVVDVGDRHRRLAELRAALDQLADADRRVGERVLAVQVEVDETCGHAGRNGLVPQVNSRGASGRDLTFDPGFPTARASAAQSRRATAIAASPNPAPC